MRSSPNNDFQEVAQRNQGPALAADELLQNTLKKLALKDDPLLQIAFAWLLVGRRPLRISELAEILQVESSPDPRLACQNLDEIAQDLSFKLRGLIVTSADGTVQFAEDSLRDHLVRMCVQNGEDTHLTKIHRLVAHTCLKLVLMHVEGARIESKNEASNQDLVQYAKMYWPYHLNHAACQGQTLPRSLQTLLYEFCRKQVCDHKVTNNGDRKATARQLLTIGVNYQVPLLSLKGMQMGFDPIHTKHSDFPNSWESKTVCMFDIDGRNEDTNKASFALFDVIFRQSMDQVDTAGGSSDTANVE